ncbi:uncharacterized protein N0V89_011191 [Didymosphaeria variabile]|uniref:Uncharacterized protein n=1 Tax=Didymosphaeria variabile TaxID=1932322 RepID=A0A9W8XER5_9PLEO|nr:uncharacterized protein N0V89_011191 [Didymosphaeria variabile]KAJ4347251.1 hypothetical protein N0V89_011191 [Didymosphaeria variabile]
MALEALLEDLYWGAEDAPWPDDAVRHQSLQLAEEIFEDYTRLHEIVIRHEPILRKRWEKRPQARRRELLLRLWPDMPDSHRPDFGGIADQKQVHFQNFQSGLLPDRILWPYLNLEDLTEAKALLMLLNSRSRNLPTMFTATEHERSVFLEYYLAKAVCLRPKHECMVLDKWDKDKYGTVVFFLRSPQPPPRFCYKLDSKTCNGLSQRDYEEHLKEFRDELRRNVTESGLSDKGHNVLLGFFNLYLQRRILDFLVHFCEEVLHDHAQASLTDDRFAIEPEPPALFENEEI